MTAAEYRQRVASAKRKARHFLGLRNFWRTVVRKRVRQMKAAATGRAARQKPHVVKGKPNTVRGGSPAERLLFAAETAMREARHYYSETGSYVEGHALTNVPNDSDRSDCSWFYIELYRCCGLPVPITTEPRYTGSILSGQPVSREYAEKHVGVAVVFGAGTGIHVGMSTGDGPNIIQHGQEPVERGTFDEFGPGTEVRYRKFAFA